MTRQRVLIVACGLLFVLYPLAWAAPLLRAGVLPIFGLTEVSVLSAIRALFDSDIFLALIVTVCAILAPLAKTAWLLARAAGWADAGASRLLALLGQVAMAEVFLVAIYITLFRAIGVGRIEVAWGLYLFTGCVLAGLVLDRLTERPAD